MTRKQEFKLLQELVMIAGRLDHGSQILWKIQRMEDLAEILTRDDMAEPRPSLMKHLAERFQ
jgi:hypothetical protein